ncbi:hypothetical protein CC85DRAFT_160509 [Cutaneotrichosporon oleaginosum]|uniref:Uncharacterized protein n=1 Tax=Cutaneotrichosporon oleaginosum TaxID=879819 RepID=A0A0J0XGG0_9TREE|nr:uncharacterized protein CC85DRAFT_160509 [Cutaneotrichosporon oleaginosum]KLT40190.1 hypothetical protein CC85DRAFT_160509 [Cutaneotrichosporon oleaginosum]TXT10519.1 hypothetical protein COLE_04453 [Cutaneotrichosporon oleaginosum]
MSSDHEATITGARHNRGEAGKPNANVVLRIGHDTSVSPMYPHTAAFSPRPRDVLRLVKIGSVKGLRDAVTPSQARGGRLGPSQSLGLSSLLAAATVEIGKKPHVDTRTSLCCDRSRGPWNWSATLRHLAKPELGDASSCAGDTPASWAEQQHHMRLSPHKDP